jgi:hypothetical protein
MSWATFLAIFSKTLLATLALAVLRTANRLVGLAFCINGLNNLS